MFWLAIWGFPTDVPFTFGIMCFGSMDSAREIVEKANESHMSFMIFDVSGQTEFCNHTWALLNITFRLFLFYVIFPLDYVSMGSKSLPSKSWWLDPNRNIWKPYLWSFWLHGMDEPTYARMPLPRLPGCWRFLWSPTVASKAGALWRCGGVHCCLLS